MIGKLIASEFKPHTDRETGAHVVRMTGGRHVCHHIYPAARSTTSDGKFLLYFREFNARRQLFALNLETGNSLQLTAGRDVDDYHAAFSADDRHVFYVQGNALWLMDARDLLRDELYRPEDGWLIREFDLTDDDRAMIVLEIAEESAGISLSGLRDWSTFALDSLAAPRCRIVYVDLAAGERWTVVEEECWLGRPSFRPGDSDTILYCHEGPYDMIDSRMWLVQADGTQRRKCREQDSDTVLTSEFWFPDGSEVGYLHWRADGPRVEEVRAIDPVTLRERIVCRCPAFAHCAVSPNGAYLVGDSLTSNDPVHLRTEASRERPLDAREDDDFIYLIALSTGEQLRLCHHGSSFLPKHGRALDSEPHPVFSRDGRSVIYVSDAQGVPCIYRVKLARFLWEHETRQDDAYAYGLARTF